ncbi:MAG: hypothetical protein KGR98_10270, partial [Verrucomicrobia bacterium]|nr:hypothetical protein [Verrucomicrobiota bacterium]
LGWTFALALSCYMGITADVSGRWTTPMAIRYLTPDKPQVKGWLPAPGGILYSEDMSIFYETFFKNPHGDWRYMVGFEPTWMPKKDVEIYESIMWNMGDPKAYTPWIKMMTPADRLVIPGGRGAPPNIPQLDWNYAVSGIWVGRLPQPVEKGTAAPTIPASKPMSTLPAPETEAVPPSG